HSYRPTFKFARLQISLQGSLRGNTMRLVANMVAINLLLMSALFAQTMKSLSPEVHEYVKVEAPVIALVHARVIDGNGSAARENQTIIIRDGNIQSVSDAATASVPPDAMNFDVTGRS